MPKLSFVPIRQRRALNRIQVAGVLPPESVRLRTEEWIKTLRVALHMTQRRLATRSGVSQGNLALIETGKLEPRLETLRKLFDTLYCDFMVLPIPRKRIADIIVEKTLGVPRRKMWD